MAAMDEGRALWAPTAAQKSYLKRALNQPGGKLPLNVFAGWLVFGYAPSGYLWLGALLILGASLFLMLREAGKEASPAT